MKLNYYGYLPSLANVPSSDLRVNSGLQSTPIDISVPFLSTIAPYLLEMKNLSLPNFLIAFPNNSYKYLMKCTLD